jgi:hypothetical protein
MSDRRPDFDELVGTDLSEPERERLLRVHELLLAADPPPELRGNEVAPDPDAAPVEREAEVRGAEVLVLPRQRHRRWLAVAVAAALVVAVFGAGAFVGNRTAGPNADFTVSMKGTPAAAEASADLVVYRVDAGGNWPMEVHVTGLQPIRAGTSYELWLTKNGKLAALCGSFRTDANGSASVPMNAPYRFKDYDGWVVVAKGTRAPLLTT